MMNNTIQNYPFHTIAARVNDTKKPYGIKLFIQPTAEYLQNDMKMIADTYSNKAAKDYFTIRYIKNFDEYSFTINDELIKIDYPNIKPLAELGKTLDAIANIDDSFVSKTRLDCGILALDKLDFKVNIDKINPAKMQSDINYLASPLGFKRAAKAMLDDFVKISAQFLELSPEEIMAFLIKKSPK